MCVEEGVGVDFEKLAASAESARWCLAGEESRASRFRVGRHTGTGRGSRRSDAQASGTCAPRLRGGEREREGGASPPEATVLGIGEHACP